MNDDTNEVVDVSLDEDNGQDSNSAQFLASLNESQKKAVTAPLSNMLLIAGAGTGKTTTLISRILYLFLYKNLLGRNILALTFTNKAAQAMKLRLQMVLGESSPKMMWVSTFHSFCLKIMRSYAHASDFSPDFTILDTGDQQGLVKKIIKDLGCDCSEKEMHKRFAYYISYLKEQGIRYSMLFNEFRRKGFINSKYIVSGSEEFVFLNVYQQYENICKSQNLVDFAELMLSTVEMLESHENIRNLLHKRFIEILVDEFQDTNAMQLRLLKLLVGPNSHITVVGDDDQSIYGWRGAEFSNLSKFIESFPDVRKYVLSVNYRSFQNILNFANALINQNEDRLIDKTLTGVKGEGDKVYLVKCQNEHYETEYVAREINRLHADGVDYKDIAILYRNNFLSLGLEQQLNFMSIPYEIYGGHKFFERVEIVNALAYLKVLLNSTDDVSLLRIINVPSRKIGPKVVAQLTKISSERHCSIMHAMEQIDDFVKGESVDKDIRNLHKKIKPFLTLIENLRDKLERMSLDKFVAYLLEVTGLREFYQQYDEKHIDSVYGKSKEGNLGMLVTNLSEYLNERDKYAIDIDDNINADSSYDTEGYSADYENTIESLPTNYELLHEYLSRIALVSSAELNTDGDDSVETYDCVNIMTIHSAKGLEFKYLFLVGFEAHVLPSEKSIEEGRLNEERRLAYVAITRAKSRLYISYAQKRRLYGMKEELHGASIFLHEIVNCYKDKEDRPFVIQSSNAFLT
jgi:DNA helicase-2/ATP-dependent DNA helicase PcrA